MKTTLLALTLAALPLLAAGPMKKEDRQRLLAHFEMTNAWLADEVKNLTPAQVAFRSEPGKWTVLDVVDHLATAEPQYWQWVEDSLKKPAPEGFKEGGPDEGVLWYGIDRTRRDKTAEAREPKHKFEDLATALDAVRKLRLKMVDYVRATEDDVRGRPLLDSKMSIYQWILMISSHSQRHILQIREIKAHPDFPAK